MTDYKQIALDPPIYEKVETLRKEHKLRSKSKAIALLIEFYESNWTETDKLDQALREIRGESTDDKTE